jgi:hypothetical protein
MTITFQTRTRGGWSDRETIEITPKQARIHVNTYRNLLKKRTGKRNKHSSTKLFDVTKMGDECITAWSGTLSQQSQAGFNIGHRKDGWMFWDNQ